MKNLILTMMFAISFTSFSQTFYGIKINKSYSLDELSSHFWDKNPVINGSNFTFTLDGSDITLQRKYSDGSIYRVFSSDLSLTDALTLFNNALSFFGTPDSGFQEKNDSDLRYYCYYNDVYKSGDLVIVEFTTSSSNTDIYVNIDYNNGIIKDSKEQPYSETGYVQGWTLIKKY